MRFTPEGLSQLTELPELETLLLAGHAPQRTFFVSPS